MDLVIGRPACSIIVMVLANWLAAFRLAMLPSTGSFSCSLARFTRPPSVLP